MKKGRLSLTSALQLLHTYLSPVFLLFFFDETVVTTYVPPAFVASQKLLLAGLCYIGKLVIGSGMCGTMAELLSGEKDSVTIHDFWGNVRDFWALTMLMHVLKVAFLFLVYFWDQAAQLTLLGACLDLPLLFLLSAAVLHKKYHAKTGFHWRAGSFPVRAMGPIVMIFMFQVAVFFPQTYLPDLPDQGHLFLILISKYLYVLLFILITKFILDGLPAVASFYSSHRELLLINPLGGGTIWEGLASLVLRSDPPVFTVIKALTPSPYTIRMFSRVFWRKRYYKPGVLVAITCYSCNSFEAYKIAKEFRKRGARVVMGGPHVTSLPDEALAFCDSVVVGEAEGVWASVLADYEKGALKPVYHAPPSETQFNQVHQYLLQAPAQEVMAYMETSRGCKFHCYFCAVYNIYEGRRRQKPVSEVVEQIRRLRSKHWCFRFIDSNIFTDPAYAKELFEALIPLKIIWTGSSSIDIAAHEDCLRLARASGCIGLLVGYEISQTSPEKKQGGKLKMADKYLEYTRKIKKAGINVKGHFMFGFDSDRFKDLPALWRFCLSVFPSWTVLSILTPIPGTQLFQDMLTEGRVMNANWKRYTTFELLLRPRQMDYAILKALYPFAKMFFFFTTSQNGWLLIIAVLLILKIFWTMLSPGFLSP
ncbi:MAG TPA: radical SAM protein [Candidatus Omnitrophota bacterium]|nr:radical SAM protein [Candidatus Omnitrophota bacterium]